MSDYEGIAPEAALLATMHRHLSFLRLALEKIRHELNKRGIMHDESKFHSYEFAGFTRINQTARLHPYGSPEYKKSLDAEAPVIASHYKNNDHHPEYYPANGMTVEDMGFLEIIEMVCDWWAAWQSYGKKQPWSKNLEIQFTRFDFSDGQWWLVKQVAEFLETLEWEDA